MEGHSSIIFINVKCYPLEINKVSTTTTKFAACKIMFPYILWLENTFIQFYFSLCAFTQSFFENNIKYLPCLMTESNLKPDKSHFIFSQTIFSFGTNLSKLPTVLPVLTARNNTLLLTEVRSKTSYYCRLIT